MLTILRELTPDNLKCGPVLGCPAVYELIDGRMLIVGDAVDVNDLPPDARRKIGVGEQAIVVSKELLGIEVQ